MAQHPYEAVMHCTVKQPNKVINLGNKVVTGLTKNPSVYTTPDPDVASLQKEVNTLATLQGAAKNGGTEATAARDAQCEKVFGMLKDELNYVNSVGKGNKDILLLSGFDVNEQPSPHQVPAKISIKRTESGPVEHSQKVYLSDNSNPNEITHQHFNYHVEITSGDTKDDKSWDDAELSDGKVGITGNSKGIVVVHLTRGTEYNVRIAAINSAGTGDWSDPTPFFAQ